MGNRGTFSNVRIGGPPPPKPSLVPGRPKGARNAPDKSLLSIVLEAKRLQQVDGKAKRSAAIVAVCKSMGLSEPTQPYQWLSGQSNGVEALVRRVERNAFK